MTPFGEVTLQVPFVRTRFFTLTAAVIAGAGLMYAPLAGSAMPAAAATASSTPVKAKVFTLPLHKVGTVNLSKLASSEHRTKVPALRQGAAISRSAASKARYRAVDNALLSHRPSGEPTGLPSSPATGLTTKNVPGELGFSGLNGIQQAQTTGGTDLEPPDQGLCAGGGYVMEFINNALAIYDKNGTELLAPVGSAQAFKQPLTAFMSDPRCYYDAPTKRWFYQEFVVGTTTSTQFEAVSNTQDPTGTYTIWSWSTTDAGQPNCPCFGDYDGFGADANGIYVTTDEFGITSGYNGVVLYGIAKGELETAPQTGIIPPVVGFRVPHDPFGQTYLFAPASSPPGAKFAPGTEYFIESNPDQLSDDHLMVYAMRHTANLTLFTSGPPTLYRTEVKTEGYAEPPDATQKAGPRPLGHAYQAPAGGLQTDFDAEMEPTYTNGHLYAQLDTGTASGTSAVDWFILKPMFSGGSLSASVSHQGRVAVKNTSLLFPYTAVNAQGMGYLLFSLSGPDNYPSPAYISYGASGATGPVIEATQGAAPEDSFTCYAAFVGPHYGGCRWGDYSMGVAMNNRIYMSTEYVPPTTRDVLTNWGTYVYSAPPPAAP
jgi:hypothetical protein